MSKSPPSLLDSVLWHVRSWDEIKAMSYFTMSNYINFALVVGLFVFAIMQARSKAVSRRRAFLRVSRPDLWDTDVNLTEESKETLPSEGRAPGTRFS